MIEVSATNVIIVTTFRSPLREVKGKYRIKRRAKRRIDGGVARTFRVSRAVTERGDPFALDN
jgi:hypothetical protein